MRSDVQDRYTKFGGVPITKNTLTVFPSILPHCGFAPEGIDFNAPFKGRYVLQWLVYTKESVFPNRKLQTDHTLTLTSMGHHFSGGLFSPAGSYIYLYIYIFLILQIFVCLFKISLNFFSLFF
jgi:hypothetical protein